MVLALSGTELEPDEPIDELCDAAAALDIGLLELWHPRNTAQAGTQATLAKVHACGLAVACVSTGSELYRNGGSEADQALLAEAVDLAAACGAPFVNTYFGCAGTCDDAAAIGTYKRLLLPCLARARAHGVTIVLENEFNAFGVDPCASDVTRRPASIERLLDEVGDPAFRLNFDAANFLCAGVCPRDAYARLDRYVAYCHLKDVSLASEDSDLVAGWRTFQDYEDRYQTRPMGSGGVGWPDLLPALLKHNGRCPLALEPHSERPLRREAWEQAAAFVRALANEAATGLARGK